MFLSDCHRRAHVRAGSQIKYNCARSRPSAAPAAPAAADEPARPSRLPARALSSLAHSYRHELRLLGDYLAWGSASRHYSKCICSISSFCEFRSECRGCIPTYLIKIGQVVVELRREGSVRPTSRCYQVFLKTVSFVLSSRAARRPLVPLPGPEPPRGPEINYGPGKFLVVNTLRTGSTLFSPVIPGMYRPQLSWLHFLYCTTVLLRRRRLAYLNKSWAAGPGRRRGRRRAAGPAVIAAVISRGPLRPAICGDVVDARAHRRPRRAAARNVNRRRIYFLVPGRYDEVVRARVWRHLTAFGRR
ncbi:hypothetical protein EVAR_67250_1 [Eumeta japonica]|uniref:Uncharacterized protein n=1 Tax=Eumeta variegata TaxID=151549 RepID=A0A4C1YQF8_EUMVA|nr:hypothetical protein EVAR_67250_1 [Eumeta japonica]